MRTTLTLDDDVARLIEDATHREHSSFKQVVNDALRRGLTRTEPTEPYDYEPHRTALRPGIDPAGFNKLADDLEDEARLG